MGAAMSTTKHTPTKFGNYTVYPTGMVTSDTGWRGGISRMMRPALDNDGYPCLRLTIEGERKKYRLHRLMATIFMQPRPSMQHEIRHLDGNKQNNRIENLAWGTRKENAADRDAHGRTSCGEKHSAAIKASNQAEGTRAFRRKQKEARNG